MRIPDGDLHVAIVRDERGYRPGRRVRPVDGYEGVSFLVARRLSGEVIEPVAVLFDPDVWSETDARLFLASRRAEPLSWQPARGGRRIDASGMRIVECATPYQAEEEARFQREEGGNATCLGSVMVTDGRDGK